MLRLVPVRGDDDARNAGASYLMSKSVEQNGHRISLASLSVHGTWHPFEKRLARGDPGINRLDRIAKAHDIDYDKAKTLKDKWAADRKMIAKIDQLPGRKSLTERIVKNIMKAKLRLGM